jgi:hypothetical protein
MIKDMGGRYLCKSLIKARIFRSHEVSLVPPLLAMRRRKLKQGSDFCQTYFLIVYEMEAPPDRLAMGKQTS